MLVEQRDLTSGVSPEGTMATAIGFGLATFLYARRSGSDFTAGRRW